MHWNQRASRIISVVIAIGVLVANSLLFQRLPITVGNVVLIVLGDIIAIYLLSKRFNAEN